MKSLTVPMRPGVPLTALGEHMKRCPVHRLRAQLKDVNLRPTRQRIALGWLLFGKGDRHVTAEMIFEEAKEARVPLSLATVYNTLHQFTEAGMLREIATSGPAVYFDTNTSHHHHFLVQESGEMLDIPAEHVKIIAEPSIPEGLEIDRVDIVVRLRPKRSQGIRAD